MTMTLDAAPGKARTVRKAGLYAASVLALGSLLFLYKYLEEVASGHSVPVAEPLIEELTGAGAAGLLLLPVLWLARRFPIGRESWLRRVPLYLSAMLAFALCHTSLMWLSREILFRLAGMGDYDYGIMPTRYAMEFPIQVIIYWIFVAGVHALDQFHESRERRVRAARLESRLARAQLENLRLQIEPHFLFNALNTISTTMYDDPAVADEMIGRLGELLRMSLRIAPAQEVPLSEELELLEAYLGIERARFGDRLEVLLDVDPAARQAAVPPFLLQPLVENAVRHGSGAGGRGGRIEVRVRRGREGLAIEVADDGPGAGAERRAEGGGLGLALTADRLRLLYGENQRFRAGDRAGGGFEVVLRLPFRAAEGDVARRGLGTEALRVP